MSVVSLSLVLLHYGRVWHCIVLQLHAVIYKGEECVKPDCILLLFTAQQVSPRGNLTLPACKLQNPTGISVALHRFVFMVCRSHGRRFQGLWFQLQPAPVESPWADSSLYYCVFHCDKNCWKPECKKLQCWLFYYSQRQGFSFLVLPTVTHGHCLSICSVPAKSSHGQLLLVMS